MLKTLSRILSNGQRQGLRASNGSSARQPHFFRRLAARYDAATTGDDNRRHWAKADGLSANAAQNAQVRRILRNRSRYEVANNSYAQGIALTLANDSIGTGPRLQLQTADAEANRRIEREFQIWAHAVGLAEKLRTMRMARAVDGEAFALMTSNPKLPTSIQLDLRLIEADQVATPAFNPVVTSSVDGIVFDSHGNPIEYHVLRHHPGDANARGALEYDRIPAASMVHWYRSDRPGQARGVPDITPALPLFAQLRRFTLAVLAAAETAADFAGILYTDAPAGGEAESAEPFEPIELEKRMLLTMPGGWKMSQLEAEQPATTYAEFKKEILNEIARCLNMPFNIAAGNSAGYNYASGRLDHQTYFKSIRVDQAHAESMVLDRILAAWFDEASLIPALLPDGLGAFVNWSHQWFWDGHEHVDPAKEANAQATRLASHTTTLADEYARRGQDWESQLRQRAKEMELIRELGLSLEETDTATVEDEEEEANV
ncbi:phage portal protein [Bremerella sp.]|uniref:phage portal protein n=1 Tax=Bremerella sp. TaxID=2795602 RepID=UPI00391C41EB